MKVPPFNKSTLGVAAAVYLHILLSDHCDGMNNRDNAMQPELPLTPFAGTMALVKLTTSSSSGDASTVN